MIRYNKSNSRNIIYTKYFLIYTRYFLKIRIDFPHYATCTFVFFDVGIVYVCYVILGMICFLLHFHSCKAVADPQSLLEEKEAAVEKLAISDYELRLAQEDISKLKTELQKKAENHSELNGIFLDLFIFYILCDIHLTINIIQFLHNYVQLC